VTSFGRGVIRTGRPDMGPASVESRVRVPTPAEAASEP
jgi:hypothetical protein